MKKIENLVPPPAQDTGPHGVLAAIQFAVDDLKVERMESVRTRLEEGSLSLHGWYFDLVVGSLRAYSPRADAFLPIFSPA